MKREDRPRVRAADDRRLAMFNDRPDGLARYPRTEYPGGNLPSGLPK